MRRAVGRGVGRFLATLVVVPLIVCTAAPRVGADLIGTFGLDKPLTFTWLAKINDPTLRDDLGPFNPGGFGEGSATFVLESSTKLKITLTNERDLTGDRIFPGEILTVMTWALRDSLGNPLGGTLTKDKAKIASGSTLLNCATCTIPGGDDLSGEWAFVDVTALNSGDPDQLAKKTAFQNDFGLEAMFGVSATAGEDVFMRGDLFNPNSNVFGMNRPSGSDGGIVGDIPGPGGDASALPPVVRNTMVFTFDITPLANDAQLWDIDVFYGTDTNELLPAPATLVLLGAGLVLLALVARRPYRRRPTTHSH